MCFAYGKIKNIKDDNIIHTASTKIGASGSPIIRRSNENYIIGIHYGDIQKEEKDNNIYDSFNLATIFGSILDNIHLTNKINCIYKIKDNESEIQLLHDYNIDVSTWAKNDKDSYIEAKEINKKIFEEKMEVYINNKKIKFSYKYKPSGTKDINVIFKFKKSLTNMSYLFYECSSLYSIDLSSFSKNNTSDMSWMSAFCSSLNSINLTSFNTNSVTNMRSMFSGCTFLKSIDLSSFKTDRVTNMSNFFRGCNSLNQIDLSSFDTREVTDMSYMFSGCNSLKSIDLSSFNSGKLTNTNYMLSFNNSLESIQFSKVKKINIAFMINMFRDCPSLQSVDLESFNTVKAKDLSNLFYGCFSLKEENIKYDRKDTKFKNPIEGLRK